MLFDTWGISKSHNTLFQLSLHLCFIIGFITYLFVARNDSWMSEKTSARTEQIIRFTTMEAMAEGWDPVKLALGPSNLLLTVPRRYIHCDFIKCSVAFHLQVKPRLPFSYL